MAAMTCRICGEVVTPADMICPSCNANLLVQEAIARPQVTTLCPECGTALDDPATAVCPHCLAPIAVRAMTVTVTLAEPQTRFVIPAGGRLLLGRDPARSPAAKALGGYGNVSRDHAEVALAADGTVTVTDRGSLNGTYVNGTRLEAGRPHRLSDGDQVRLGANAVLYVSAG